MKPAYEALIAMVEDLSEKYDEEDGVWRLKNGSRFYQTALNRTTTTTMTSDQIHELGLKEVERIHGEMEVIKDKVECFVIYFYFVCRDSDLLCVCRGIC